MIARLPQSRRRTMWTTPALVLLLFATPLTRATGQSTADPKPIPSESPASQPADDRSRIPALIRQTRLFFEAGAYRKALELVNDILKIDPANDFALSVKPFLEDNHPLVKAQEITAAQLDHPVSSVEFDAVGLSDVIDYLHDISGLNISVNWRSLAAAKIDRSTPVSASLRNVKFSKALSVVLESVGQEKTTSDTQSKTASSPSPPATICPAMWPCAFTIFAICLSFPRTPRQSKPLPPRLQRAPSRATMRWPRLLN